ncbi:MAG: Uncharacterised protein [Methanobacteriota archaeon]|nr:MAG: Uncharacterised protein [Euryarchaeota archaeon]
MVMDTEIIQQVHLLTYSLMMGLNGLIMMVITVVIIKKETTQTDSLQILPNVKILMVMGTEIIQMEETPMRFQMIQLNGKIQMVMELVTTQTYVMITKSIISDHVLTTEIMMAMMILKIYSQMNILNGKMMMKMVKEIIVQGIMETLQKTIGIMMV